MAFPTLLTRFTICTFLINVIAALLSHTLVHSHTHTRCWMLIYVLRAECISQGGPCGGSGLEIGLPWLSREAELPARLESSLCLKCALASASTASPKKSTWHQAAATSPAPGETEATAELGFGSWSWSWSCGWSWSSRRCFVFCMKRKSSRLFGASLPHIPAQWCHTMSRADLTAAAEAALGGQTLDGACAPAPSVHFTFTHFSALHAQRPAAARCGGSSNVNSANSTALKIWPKLWSHSNQNDKLCYARHEFTMSC